MESYNEIARDLVNMVTKFEVESFCGYWANMIRQSAGGTLPDSLSIFKSIQKDFTFLIALNYFNQKEESTVFIPWQVDVSKLGSLVNALKTGLIGDGHSLLRMNVDSEYLRKAHLHVQMFSFFHNNGLLNYMEQEVERIQMIYKPHDAAISACTGLGVADYLSCFIALENIQRLKYDEATKFMRDERFLEQNIFDQSRDEDELNERFAKLPIDLQDSFIRLMQSPNEHLYVDVDDLAVFIEQDKATAFLNIFSSNPTEYKGYMNYDEVNPLDSYPLLRFMNRFMHTNSKEVLGAINRHLFNTLKEVKGSSRAHRAIESQLEVKTSRVLRSFFSQADVKVYENYYMPTNEERDILIEIEDKLIICECKSAKLRSPLRNLDRFDMRVRDDFKRSIQAGYDQAISVARSTTLESETLLYDSKKRTIGKVERKRLSNVYIWVITERSLGPAQVDLSQMLDTKSSAWSNTWSLSVDDLETFLLYLAQKPKKYSRLFDYLKYRPRLYGRVISPDELDVAGWYVSNRKDFIAACMSTEGWVLIDLEWQKVFDAAYHSDEGLGFPNFLRESLWQP